MLREEYVMSSLGVSAFSVSQVIAIFGNLMVRNNHLTGQCALAFDSLVAGVMAELRLRLIESSVELSRKQKRNARKTGRTTGRFWC